MNQKKARRIRRRAFFLGFLFLQAVADFTQQQNVLGLQGQLLGRSVSATGAGVQREGHAAPVSGFRAVAACGGGQWCAAYFQNGHVLNFPGEWTIGTA